MWGKSRVINTWPENRIFKVKLLKPALNNHSIIYFYEYMKEQVSFDKAEGSHSDRTARYATHQNPGTA